MRMLLVEDNDDLAETILDRLRAESHSVDRESDGEEANELLRFAKFDIVLLDINLPGRSGYEVLRSMRARGDTTPVLIITARSQVDDRVIGLDAGADDYLVKPFALEELLARLRVMLRRAEPPADRQPVLRFADLVLDPDSAEVRRGDRAIELTRTEFDLLRTFMEHPNQVLSRDVLHERVWGYDASTASNTLEVYVGYVRRKLEADGEPRLLQTVRGFGYALRIP